jgi:mannose-6-phosphate isomerase
MILCEVQEYSDLTYRIYDYGRVNADGKARDLHIEKALRVMKFVTDADVKTVPLTTPTEAISASLLAAWQYFATERWEFSSRFHTRSCADRFELLAVLSGSGRLGWQDGITNYRQGQCCLIPAALGDFSVLPDGPSTMLKIYVPDLAVLRDELNHEGFPGTAIAKTVFN